MLHIVHILAISRNFKIKSKRHYYCHFILPMFIYISCIVATLFVLHFCLHLSQNLYFCPKYILLKLIYLVSDSWGQILFFCFCLKMFLFHIYSWSVLDGYRTVWQILSQHISGIIPLSLASVWLLISQLSASLLWAAADSVLCWQNLFWRLKGFYPQMLSSATGWQPMAVNQMQVPFLETGYIWILLWPTNQVTGKTVNFEWEPEQEMARVHGILPFGPFNSAEPNKLLSVSKVRNCVEWSLRQTAIEESPLEFWNKVTPSTA